MKKANIKEAKAHLSKLLKLAANGEEVIICSAGQPVAKLVSIETVKSKTRKKKTRKPGIWKGKGKIEKDFDELPESFSSFTYCAKHL